MRKAVTAFIVGLALVGGAVAVGTAAEPRASAAPAGPSASPTVSPGEPDLPKADEERGWVGSPSDDLVAVSSVVSETIGDHEDVFAGSEFARDYSSLTVFTTDLEASEVDALKAAIRHLPAAQQVRFAQVHYSMEELMAAADSIDVDSIAGAQLAGPDVSTNGVRLGRDDTIGAGPEVGSRLRLSDPRLHAKKRGPGESRRLRSSDPDLSEVPVHVFRDRGGATTMEDRYNDAGPYFTMGAAIFGGSSRCSLGVPLKVNGTFMALTAGHCTASTFKNQAGATVGTQYTTSYSANAQIYGDWKLIKGQHYNLSVWSGGPKGGTTLAMTGADWKPRALGLQVCTSGSTTGQVCRFVVKAVNQPAYMDGVLTKQLTLIKHDGDLNGVYDCSGTQGGDSGGPVYYANGSGGVIANGIVTGGNTSRCEYWYTQLQGVRAWNSSVVFG